MKNLQKNIKKNILHKEFYLILFSVWVVPFAYAQALTVEDLIGHAKDIVASLVPLFIGLALVYFIYGLAEYIGVSGQEAKKEEGRTRMLWGVIAMFVIVSVWGLVTLIQATVFTTGSGGSLTAPPQPKFSS